MTSPQYNQVTIPPGKMEIAWIEETGAAGVTPSGTFTIEPCKPELTLMSEMADASAYFGEGVTMIDWVEMSHHAELSMSGDVRLDGFIAVALAAILGDHDNSGTVETTTAGTVTTHLIKPGSKGNRCPTFSIPYQTGSGDVLHLTYMTVDQIKLTATKGSPLKYDMKLVGFFPSADTTMPAVQDMSDLSIIAAANCVANLIGSNGALYGPKVLAASITLDRKCQVETSISSGTLQPLEIVPDELTMTIDSVDLFYNGIAQAPGTGATATATISGGAVTSVAVSGGTGYSVSAPPTVTFSGGGGSGALAVCTVNADGTLGASATIISGGSGYTSAPTATVVTPVSPFADFMNKALWGGSDAAPSSFSWHDGASNQKSLTIKFWTAKWNTDVKMTAQNAAIHLTGSIHVQQDYTNLRTNHRYSAPSAVAIVNHTSTALVI